jgi:hypothetical protein
MNQKTKFVIQPGAGSMADMSFDVVENRTFSDSIYQFDEPHFKTAAETRPFPPIVSQSRIPKPKYNKYTPEPKSQMLSLSINESPSASVLIKSKQEVARKRLEKIRQAKIDKNDKFRSHSVTTNK